MGEKSPFNFKNMKQKIIIRPMLDKDVEYCLDLKYQYFGHFYGNLDDPKTKIEHHNYARKKLNLSVSLIAEINEKIVGGYILRKTGLPIYSGNFYDFSKDSLTGVEGVSLFVDSKYKGLGIGHKLKHYYKEKKHPEISFIWGMAFHGLNNIKDWLKTRTLFNDLEGVYYTIEFYRPESINKYKKRRIFILITKFKNFIKRKQCYI
jgi:GNAT superfamily N-acetyltransferase